MTTPVEKLLAKLPDAKRSGKGWSARCPAHDDQRPSLSIAEGDDGRALVNCHAGCTVEKVCAAVGLTVGDLMPSGSTAATCNKPPHNTKPRGKAFDTAGDAIANLERQSGASSAQWTYHEVHGEAIGVVVRWDLQDGGKEIRPLSRHDDGWRVGGMPEPRPLYGLPDLASANRVFVCEGEKAAEAVRALGLVATTSPHGCSSAAKADWGPLAGKEVVILPDNDSPGRKYADIVTELLSQLTPAAVVKVVDLPGLPNHGDAADFVESHDETAAVELRRIVEELADAAEPLPATEPVAVDCYTPFPVDSLPDPIRGFVVGGAKAIGCDPSYIALPLLAVMATAIGTTRRLLLKRGWTVPSILWIAIVGESGTAKTPAFALAMKPLRKHQDKALARNKDAMRDYDTKILHYDKEMAAWKRDGKTTANPPPKPDRPEAERCIVGDITVEAVAPLLLANPRGVLLARDELAGWIGSFDRYSGGKGGADAAHWLSMHNGESIIVDRKSGNPPTIAVLQAAVSVCGGIQPAILHRALGIEHRESGLAARLLLACPRRTAKRWTEADIDPKSEEAIAQVLERLLELEQTIGIDGEQTAVVVELTPDAKAQWKSYFNAHAREQADLTGELAAAWSKLEEYAARLALVIHFIRWAANDPTLANAKLVDLKSMACGVELVKWFKGQARRVYSLLGESGEKRERRRLIEWIELKGGAVTPREVQQGCRWLKKPEAAEAALDQLAKAGVGRWRGSSASAKGGRPTRAFELLALSTVHKTPTDPGEVAGFVDVDTGDDGAGAEDRSPLPTADEWGEI